MELKWSMQETLFKDCEKSVAEAAKNLFKFKVRKATDNGTESY